MFRPMTLFFVAAMACAPLIASAHDMSKMPGSHVMKQKPVTVTGEVVDTGCYLGHGSRGDAHQECAAKCISSGMPMGLLTKDGKLYLLTLNHDNPDPYNQMKDMAGKNVSVTGVMMERAGMKGLDVSAVKLAMAANTK